MANRFRFRGKDLNTLGQLNDEVVRIANEAPEDAEDFKACYIVYQMRSNEAITIDKAEEIVFGNIHWFARNSIMWNDYSDYEKILKTFYPKVEEPQEV